MLIWCLQSDGVHIPVPRFQALCRENRTEFQKVLRGGWAAMARGETPVDQRWDDKLHTYGDFDIVSHVLAAPHRLTRRALRSTPYPRLFSIGACNLESSYPQ